MYNRFLQYITSNNLFEKSDNLLVTVSGGIDSVVLLHLVSKYTTNFSVAHCNFQLRGIDADKDQEFVEQLTVSLGGKFHTVNFNTNEYAATNKISIQMAARELRYNWFNKLSEDFKYSKILVAHNKNDVAETMLINLTRGTGIKGLTGISKKSQKIVRPLLFAERAEIELYAKDNKIHFREDASNAETKYARNKIRHKVLPIFKELNPAYLDNFTRTAAILNSIEHMYNRYLDDLKESLFVYRDNAIYLPVSQLKTIEPEILFSLLEEFQFTFDTIHNLVLSLDEQPGKEFYSDTYRMIKDRDYVIIDKPETIIEPNFTIRQTDVSVENPIKLKISRLEYTNGFSIPVSNKIACLAFDKLAFPLVIRKWNEGDYFYPLGMKGKKKLSDFFVDNKFSKLQKEKTWLLCSGNDIVWIIGHRIDDRFKLTPSTQQMLFLELFD